MDVFVSVFDHQHGRDVCAYAEAEAPVAEGARVPREWWIQARERDESLPEVPPTDDAEAMELYFTALEGLESFEIVLCPVQGMPALPDHP